MSREEELVVLIHSLMETLSHKVSYYTKLCLENYVDGHRVIQRIMDDLDKYIEEYKSLKKETNGQD
jgi:hypothetical protein